MLGRRVGGSEAGPSQCSKFHQLLTDKYDMRSVVSRPGLDDAVITQCGCLSDGGVLHMHNQRNNMTRERPTACCGRSEICHRGRHRPARHLG